MTELPQAERPYRETYAEGSRRIYQETPYLEWAEFLDRFVWNQGEHVTIIGPTGFGKSHLTKHLLGNPPVGTIKPRTQHWFWKDRGRRAEELSEAPRGYVVIFATKPRDDTIEAFKQSGYIEIPEWRGITPDFHPDVYPHRIVKPKAQGLGQQKAQRAVILPALNQIFAEGGWVVVIDEALYTTDQELVNLRTQYRDFLLRARSNADTVVSLIQRPAWIPREAYSQVRHLFLFRTKDESDLDSIQGIGGLSGKRIRAIVVNLQLHEILYVNALSEDVYRTMTPA